MPGNSFGEVFRISTYGESHGRTVGVIIDGCPPGIELSEDDLQPALDRRRPGQSEVTTPRDEADSVEIHSGVFEGRTTGTPIMLQVRNKDQRSKDYSNLAGLYRPSHADYTYAQKYGNRDYRGGGRSSARETLARVAAGEVARKLLETELSLEVVAFVEQVYTEKIYSEAFSHEDAYKVTRAQVDASIVRCPAPEAAARMEKLILEMKEAGDSVGGIIRCVVRGMPVGLGEPVFHKLAADLGRGMLSINAVKGFEFGSGFSCVEYRGSEHNDEMAADEGSGVRFVTNRAGGTLGGISSGAPLDFRVAFKPTATVLRAQKTVDKEGKATEFTAKGRHDPCVLPRAVPIVESMAYLVLADHLLRSRTYQGETTEA